MYSPSISSSSPKENAHSHMHDDAPVSRRINVNDAATHGDVKRGYIEDRRTPHIGIVGAGLAGLRCAGVLLEHGFSVTIIEGRDHIGGRLRQRELPDNNLVDMGPNWVHGTQDNPILELARATKTPLINVTSTCVFDEDGKPLSLEECEMYPELLWDMIQEALVHSNEHCADISPNQSLRDFLKSKVIERIPSSEEGFERKRKIVMQLAELWGAYIGSPVAKQSLKNLWLEECLGGDNLFCGGTYATILREVAVGTSGARTIFNKTVQRIETASAMKGKPRVIFEQGDAMEFDEIVFTAPLGWLKQNLTAFQPALPLRIQQAVQNLGYGCLEKVFVTFPRAFWVDPDGKTPRSTQSSQWLAPKYSQATNPDCWPMEMVELASLPPPAQHPSLMFYLYGETSRHVMDATNLLPTRAEKDAFLNRFFSPYYSLLPNFDAQSTDCQPVSFLESDWLHDDLAGNGSYTNFQIGLQDGDKDVEALRAGVPAERLWLAGEHTAPFVGLGTATGAYWSGERVAHRVVNVYERVDQGQRINLWKTLWKKWFGWLAGCLGLWAGH